MSKKKTLHVPDAPFRPGDKPNFKDLNLPKAGEAEKPDTLYLMFEERYKDIDEFIESI